MAIFVNVKKRTHIIYNGFFFIYRVSINKGVKLIDTLREHIVLKI